MTPEVLSVDNHLLFVAKPAGLATVPDESGDESLLEWAKAWVAREFAKPGAVFLGVVHRLDRPVSGVVLFARTSKAAGRLSAQFRARAVRKLYVGVGAGRPSAQQGELVQWLEKDEVARRVRPVRSGTTDAREAVTRWRVLAERDGRTLFAFEPLTGRPHQLRAAAAALGTPLLGDLKYGAAAPLADRSVALHAVSLCVEHPTRGEPIEVRLPPSGPAWEPFAEFLRDLDRPRPRSSN